jgi:hypothetical protein
MSHETSSRESAGHDIGRVTRVDLTLLAQLATALAKVRSAAVLLAALALSVTP